MALLPCTVQLPPLSGHSSDPDWVVGFAHHVESSGFDGIGVVEHSVMFSHYQSQYPYAPSGRVNLPADVDLPDPIDLLAFLAGQTTRLRLTTAVLVLPQHHPVVLAKRLATVDQLSRGRLRVAVGVGWLTEELEACGVDPQTRGKRADEQIQVMRRLWSGDATGVSFHGDFFSFHQAVSRPQPYQPGGIPLLMGGHSIAAARRAGRLGDGLQPIGVRGDDLAVLVSEMRQAAEQAGRDADGLELVLGHAVDQITVEHAEQLANNGATGLMLRMNPHTDLDAACDELSACAQRLGLR